MIRKIILFIVVVMLFINQSIAYGGGNNTNINNSKSSISGKVIDNLTCEPLAGVMIFVQGTDIKTYSDLDGNFSIKCMEPGKYNLIFSIISYKNSIIENLKLEPNKKENLEVKLIVLK